MEQINQLKAMRDAALERLQTNPDFRLVNSLDALIRDLQDVVAITENTGSGPLVGKEIPVETPADTVISTHADNDVTTALEEITASAGDADNVSAMDKLEEELSASAM